MELKASFRKQYDQVAAAWHKAIPPERDEGVLVGIEGFDALLDFLIGKGFFLEQAVEIVEKGMIERALRQTGDNQLQAAKLLGNSPQHIAEKDGGL